MAMIEKQLPRQLELSREEMSALGYQVVDMLVEHFGSVRDKTVAHRTQRADLEQRLRTPIPQHGTPAEVVLQQLQQDVFSNMAHVNHPRFFAYVPIPGNFVGVMAETLAAGFNVFAGTWQSGAGPTEIELVTIDWLR